MNAIHAQSGVKISVNDIKILYHSEATKP